MGRLSKTVVDSPVGPLTIVAGEGRVLGLFFEGHGRRPVIQGVVSIAELRWLPDATGTDDAAVARVRAALDDYFEGRDPGRWAVAEGLGTPFERAVWDAIATVPWGATATYGELANRIGAPAAVRAVGAAVGANPLSILVPCHRVIGASGAITGYAGGVDRKAWLLAHESPAPRMTQGTW